MLQDIWNDALVPAIVLILTTLVTILTSYAVKALKKWGERLEMRVLRDALFQLGDAVAGAVQTVNQTFVWDAKAASEDGRLTAAEATAALEHAIGVAKNRLSDDVLRILAEALGGASKVDLVIADMIEQEIASTKED